MRDRKWHDCPSCGAKGSMFLKKKFYEKYHPKGYPPIKVGPLTSYICKYCKDGIYKRKSLNLIYAQVAEHIARHDAKTTVIDDVMPVSEASKLLKITRQAIQNLMKAGKIGYVFLGRMRLPKKKSVLKYKEMRA